MAGELAVYAYNICSVMSLLAPGHLLSVVLCIPGLYNCDALYWGCLYCDSLYWGCLYCDSLYHGCITVKVKAVS